MSEFNLNNLTADEQKILQQLMAKAETGQSSQTPAPRTKSKAEPATPEDPNQANKSNRIRQTPGIHRPQTAPLGSQGSGSAGDKACRTEQIDRRKRDLPGEFLKLKARQGGKVVSLSKGFQEPHANINDQLYIKEPTVREGQSVLVDFSCGICGDVYRVDPIEIRSDDEGGYWVCNDCVVSRASRKRDV